MINCSTLCPVEFSWAKITKASDVDLWMYRDLRLSLLFEAGSVDTAHVNLFWSKKFSEYECYQSFLLESEHLIGLLPNVRVHVHVYLES